MDTVTSSQFHTTHTNSLKVIKAEYYNCSKVVVEYTFSDSP